MTDKAPVARNRKVAAKRKPKQSAPAKLKRERTPEEQQQYEKQMARWKARPERPISTIQQVVDGDKTNTIIDMAEDQDGGLYNVAMFEALGTRSIPFLNHTLDQVTRVMSPSRNITATQHNATMAFLAAVEPENELEATLAAQMFAANDCAMRCMRSMVGSDFVDQHKMYGDLANKFMRTFAAQVEALAKLRRKGEQVVKHVHVHEGGQAVVADTINQTGGRVELEDDGQAYGAEAIAGSTALLSHDAQTYGVPITGNAERTLQATRGALDGSAERQPECVEARPEVG